MSIKKKYSIMPLPKEEDAVDITHLDGEVKELYDELVNNADSIANIKMAVNNYTQRSGRQFYVKNRVTHSKVRQDDVTRWKVQVFCKAWDSGCRCCYTIDCRATPPKILAFASQHCFNLETEQKMFKGKKTRNRRKASVVLYEHLVQIDGRTPREVARDMRVFNDQITEDAVRKAFGHRLKLVEKRKPPKATCEPPPSRKKK